MVEYEPAGQGVHAAEVEAASVPEYDPAGQVMHVADVVAASSVEYVPAEHGVQAVAPCSAEYEPAGQRWHGSNPSGLYVPALHGMHCSDHHHRPR